MKTIANTAMLTTPEYREFIEDLKARVTASPEFLAQAARDIGHSKRKQILPQAVAKLTTVEIAKQVKGKTPDGKAAFRRRPRCPPRKGRQIVMPVLLKKAEKKLEGV